MQSSRDQFLDILKKNRKGKGTGIYSVCSAHPMVIEAAMRQAQEDGSIVLIESTSNQVDQFGGYTGMKPPDFVKYVKNIAGSIGFDEKRILLGGDHLGPNAWQKENASDAMAKARDLVRAYVSAGFEKIHLDTSMFCADDKGDRQLPLDDKIVSDRASELCKIAEDTWKECRSDCPKPLYIIGTEVPVPGGAKEHEEGLRVTDVAAVDQTIEITKKAFLNKGLDDAWSRVVGVVVQPGVEFGNEQIFNYVREKAVKLSKNILKYPNLVYEAHSTDYQSRIQLRELSQDHFCIQKVGPWLTFAYREAVYALDDIEKELFARKIVSSLSNLKETQDQVMLKKDGYWQKYYPGSAEEKSFARKYSLSDRSRYYWTDAEIQSSVQKLMEGLGKVEIPVSLLSQYLPNQYNAVRDGRIKNNPKEIVLDRVRDVMRIYSSACGMTGK